MAVIVIPGLIIRSPWRIQRQSE